MLRTLFLLTVTAVALWAEKPGGGEPNQLPSNNPDPAGPPAPDAFSQMFPLLIVVGVMVLIMWTGFRKQKREQNEHKQLVENLKVGQKVITAGGIQGSVVRKGESDVDVKTGDAETGATITFGLAAITKVVTGDESADDNK